MVKKVLSAVALASVFAAAPAMAQTGGFTGPGATQVGTVTQLKTLPDPKLPRNSSVLTFSLSGFAGICC